MPARRQRSERASSSSSLVADLLLAARVLVEARVVHRHHDEAELHREAIVLVLELRRLERLVRNDARHREVAVGLDEMLRTPA